MYSDQVWHTAVWLLRVFKNADYLEPVGKSGRDHFLAEGCRSPMGSDFPPRVTTLLMAPRAYHLWSRLPSTHAELLTTAREGPNSYKLPDPTLRPVHLVSQRLYISPYNG